MNPATTITTNTPPAPTKCCLNPTTTCRVESETAQMLVMYERYNARAGGFLVGWSERYPPFEFTTDAIDNNGYPPIRLNLPPAPESLQRSAVLNVFKAIPHYLLLMIFLVGAAAVAVVGWFTVLFTGAWPAAMRGFLVRVSNYQFRIWTYVVMADNEYPRFGLPAA